MIYPRLYPGEAQRKRVREEEEMRRSERDLALARGRAIRSLRRRFAPLAQLVEHLTLNQGVQGSSP